MSRRTFTATTILTAAALTLAACAQSPASIEAQQVSAVPYQGMSCAQARSENARIQNRLAAVTAQQESRAASDAMMMGVGLLLFAPAVLFVGHGHDHADEIGRLRGEAQAVNARLAGC